MTNPILGVTMGDPAGVGPEIIVRAGAEPGVQRTSRPVVIGSASTLEEALALVGSPLRLHSVTRVAGCRWQPFSSVPRPVPRSNTLVEAVFERHLDGVDPSDRPSAFADDDRVASLDVAETGAEIRLQLAHSDGPLFHVTSTIFT